VPRLLPPSALRCPLALLVAAASAAAAPAAVGRAAGSATADAAAVTTAAERVEPGAAWAAAEAAADAVVLVEYVLEKPGRGFGDAGQRVDLATVGTIVRPDGLVLISDNVFAEDPEESRAPARPRDFLARLRDGRRVKARLLGRDRDRSLAALQLDAGPKATFPHVELDPQARLAPGARVLLITLLPERYEYAPTFVPATVTVRLPGSRELWDVDAFVAESTIGTPVLDATGRVAGLVATDPFGSTSAGSLAAPLKLVGAVTRLKEPGFPVIVPAADVAPLVAEPPTQGEDDGSPRAWLGVTLQPVDRNLAEYLDIAGPSGVMVTSVWARPQPTRACRRRTSSCGLTANPSPCRPRTRWPPSSRWSSGAGSAATSRSR